MRKWRVAVVTCYDQRDYIRARVLRAAFAAAPDVEMTVYKNRHKGLLRYPEMALRLLTVRFGRHRPDAYVVTFRGYEILLYMLLSGIRKPIIFDELVNMVEYYHEHGQIEPSTNADRLLRRLYGWMLRRCRLILADTEGHADLSAELCSVPRDRYRVVPVGTDETVFQPAAKRKSPKPFSVFYYGNVISALSLHGLQYVMEAAVLLKDRKDISFMMVAGGKDGAVTTLEAVQRGAHITYVPWLQLEEIAKTAQQSGLCLGGPFGGTQQAELVITGKTFQFLAAAAPVLIGKNKVNGLFEDRRNCLMVRQADPKALAEAIAWAADHPKELAAIAKAGRALYEKYFSQKIINRLVADIVEELR